MNDLDICGIVNYFEVISNWDVVLIRWIERINFNKFIFWCLYSIVEGIFMYFYIYVFMCICLYVYIRK